MDRLHRPAPGTIPDAPGVYRFRDEHGRVIYVGKAKTLRSRLNSYFGDLCSLHPRTRQMVTTAASVEWTVVSTEVEALQLEYNWIKEFDPRFNVRYRDDKSYPVLAVTLNEEFPALRARLGDPGNSRPAHQGVPGPGVFGRRVQAAWPDRPAVPAGIHRQMFGAMCR
jgi:excinuclease UvrABC nuclease subunit